MVRCNRKRNPKERKEREREREEEEKRKRGGKKKMNFDLGGGRKGAEAEKFVWECVYSSSKSSVQCTV